MSARRHCGCGKALCRQNRSGLCRRCSNIASATPDVIARRAATLRRRLATEPDMLARYRAQLDGTRTGPVNERRIRRLRAAKLPGWLPIEYRPLWSELRRELHLTAPEARAAIETQMAVDARAYARTGALQQTKGDARC